MNILEHPHFYTTISDTVNEQHLNMEVDPGAAVSIISDSTHKELFLALTLYLSKVILKTYMDEWMESVGLPNVHVWHSEQVKPLPLMVIVVDGSSFVTTTGSSVFNSIGTELQECKPNPTKYRLC